MITLFVLTAAAFLSALKDEPRPFLVVAGTDFQVVVDVGKLNPSNNDNQRTIKQLPEQGITDVGGGRLAYAANSDGGRAIFVVDLAPGVADHAPHQASQPKKGLDLIGWTGRGRVLIRDREDPHGDMLRIVDARLPKDSTFGERQDVTTQPGTYKHASINSKNEIAYFSVKQGDQGSVVIWSHGRNETLIENVSVSTLCWSPDGAKVAIAQTGTVTIFNREAPDKPVTHKLLPAKAGQPARIGSMAWKPDGQSIALLPDWPEPDHPPANPRVWSLDVKSGACTTFVPLSVPATSLRWLPDTGCDTTLEEACKLAVQPVRAQRP